MKQKYVFFITLLLLSCSFPLYAQHDIKETNFWLAFGSNADEISDSVNLQIRLVAGNQAVTGNIYFTHLNDSVSFSVASNSVFTYILTPAQKKAVYNETPGISNYSVHITSTVPVVIYAINQLRASTDATCILPVTALGTDYFHISVEYNRYFDDAYAVVATQNNTQIYHNDTLVATLNGGEVYYRQASFNNDMIGDHVISDKPVAFFAMHQLAEVPITVAPCDHLFEQLSPVPTWGKTFFVPVIYRGKDIVRIMVSQDGTTISQTGGTILTGGQQILTNLNAGQWVELEASLDSNGCYIQADKPVGICTFLAGTNYTRGLYYPYNNYSDPAQAWLPALEQKIKSALVSPFILNGFTNIHIHRALIITPTNIKDSTFILIGNGTEQALSGGTWYNHSSGYSFYDMPLTNDTAAYLFTNRVGGLIVMCYGTGNVESYYYLAGSAMRNLEAVFHVNDIHYQELVSEAICEQPVHFRAEIGGQMSTNAGYLKWYIDNVEEVAARDQLSWSKTMPPDVYQIKMVILYEDDIATQTLETTLTIVSLTVDIEATPEFCNKEDGTITLIAHSENPLTIKYSWEGLPDTTAIVTGLKAGTYKVMISDAFCTIEETIIVDHIDGPVAEFEANPLAVAYGEEIKFTDKSVQGDGTVTNWYWNFGDETDSYLQNPVHRYTVKSGYITILLNIEDEFGCRDSIKHEILLWGSLDFSNVFSPIGSDGKRYVFHPLEDAGYFEEFTMEIYNRWGVPVWHKQCKAPDCPDYNDSFWWNGSNKSGKQVPDGVYYWVVSVRYSFSNIQPITKNGSVTVFNK